MTLISTFIDLLIRGKSPGGNVRLPLKVVGGDLVAVWPRYYFMLFKLSLKGQVHFWGLLPGPLKPAHSHFPTPKITLTQPPMMIRLDRL